MITQEYLKSRFSYNPDTGVLTRLRKDGTPWKVTGTVEESGYLEVVIRKRRYKAHRLIWMLVHGVWPKSGLDHINRVKTDNRIANLREATPLENSRNADWQSFPESGYRGVWKPKHSERWGARITLLGKALNLGYYDTPEEASAAYEKFAEAIHGEFYRKAQS